MVRISFLTTPRTAAETCDPMGGASAPPYSIVANTAAFGNGFCAAAGIFPAARQKMRRKCENHLAIGHRFCYYEKAVLADIREGGASTNGKMSVLRQGRELRHSGEPLSPPFQPHLETQCEARQGHRGRQTPARLRMHKARPIGRAFFASWGNLCRCARGRFPRPGTRPGLCRLRGRRPERGI